MNFHTALGELELTEDEVLIFAEGLFGFEQLKHWALRESGELDLYWLISLEDKNIAFVLWNVQDHLADYQVKGFELAQGHRVYNILTIRQNKKQPLITANMLAPVIINSQEHKGIQFVMQESGYSTQAPLFLGEVEVC
ncbi:MAG: flagellar assembly protein FliW [Desulfitobacteriaceae bacterium]